MRNNRWVHLLFAIVPRRDWWWNLSVEWYAFRSYGEDRRYERRGRV